MELQLSSVLGVSRTPVREAMRLLSMEGLVRMSVRRGTIVEPIKESDLRDALEVREALEELAVRKACRNMDELTIQTLRKLEQEFELSLEKNDMQTSARLDVQFHERITEAAHNRRLTQSLTQLREELYRYRLENLKDPETYPILVQAHGAPEAHREPGECTGGTHPVASLTIFSHHAMMREMYEDSYMISLLELEGAGSVGATIAYTLSLETLATEILLIDINEKKANGEALDIVQSTAFRDPISVTSGDYADAKGSNIVIITSGMGRKPGMTRLDLAKTNVSIMRDIAGKIAPVCPYAKYIIVSNPVDILTYVFMKESGIPESQIIGSGTQLDSARLRHLIADECGVSSKNVHAYVFGEHGDSSFVPWSVAHVAGVPVAEYYKTYAKNKDAEFDPDRIIDTVRKSGGVIIADKGATFYAIAVSVVKLCRMILSSENSVTTISTMMHGEYGLRDVCVSVSCLVGPNGVEKKIILPLTDEELEKLKASAAVMHQMVEHIYGEDKQ